MIQTKEQLNSFISFAKNNANQILNWLLCKQSPKENIDNRKFTFRKSEADKVFDYYVNLHNLDYIGINQNGIIEDSKDYSERLDVWKKENPKVVEDTNKKVKMWIKENLFQNKTIKMLQWIVPSKSIFFISDKDNFETVTFQLIKNIIYSYHIQNKKMIEIDFKNKAGLKSKYNYNTILSAIVNELEKLLLLHDNGIFPQIEAVKSSFEYFNLYHKIPKNEFSEYVKMNYISNIFFHSLSDDVFNFFKLKSLTQEFKDYKEISPSLLFDYFESYLTYVILFHFNMHYNYSLLDLELQTVSSYLRPAEYCDKISENSIIKKDLINLILPSFFDIVIDFSLTDYRRDLTKQQEIIAPEEMKTVFYTPTEQDEEKSKQELDERK